MRVTKICRTFLALTILMCCSVALAQQESTPKRKAAQRNNILSLLPDNTFAFAVINRPATLLKKAETLSAKLELPIPAKPIDLIETTLPAIEYVDLSRPAAVALTPHGLPVGGVILIPVTDFQKFVEACGAEDGDTDEELVEIDFAGDQMVAAAYRRYALLTDASDASAIKAVKNNEGKVANEFAAMRQRMASGDISGGATRAGIEIFGMLGKQGIRAIQAQIESAGEDDLPGMSPKNIVEALSIYTLLIEQVEETVQSYAFTISVKNNAIVGQDILRLKECELAEKLGQIEASDTDWRGLLPAGRPIFFAAGETPQALTPGVLAFSKKAMLAMSSMYGMDEDQIERLIDDAKPLMDKTRGMAFMMSVPRAKTAPLYAGAGGIIKVEGNAEQYLDDYIELVGQMGQSIGKISDNAMIQFTAPQKIEIDGKPALRLTVEVNLSIGGEDSEEQREFDAMMSKIYGPGGKLKIFMMAANDDTVAFGYTSQANVKRFTAAANGEAPRTLASLPAYKTVGTHLSEDAQWIGALDPGNYFMLIRRFIESGAVPDSEFPKIDIPAIPIGFGVVASEQEVAIQGAVTINSIKRLVKTLKDVLGDPQDVYDVEFAPVEPVEIGPVEIEEIEE